jgi:ABC-type Fe3+ transport system permease subunit
MFVTFIREVSASMMLFTYGTETMSIALIRITETSPWGVASAFGILQTMLLLGCVALLRLIPVGPKK